MSTLARQKTQQLNEKFQSLRAGFDVDDDDEDDEKVAPRGIAESVPEGQEGDAAPADSSSLKAPTSAVSPTSSHLPTTFELRMLVMGERFKRLQESIKSPDAALSPVGPGLGSASAEEDPSLSPRSRRTAKERWDRIRTLVMRQKASLTHIEKDREAQMRNAAGFKMTPEEELEMLSGYWRSGELAPPPPPAKFVAEFGSTAGLFKTPTSAGAGAGATAARDAVGIERGWGETDEGEDVEADTKGATGEVEDDEDNNFLPPDPPLYEKQFATQADPVSLTVSRVPEEVLLAQKEAVDATLMEERRKTADLIKAKEVDIIWREHIARNRVISLETAAQSRIAAEKEKYGNYLRDKETELGRSFRRAREDLEDGLRRQQAAIKEKYGEYNTDEVALARRANVQFEMLPQPIEMRIHFLRAVKTKLPKGAYVLMLSQYDRLGGRPLRFQNISPYGIGPGKPAVSNIARHQGRYFDRSMRFEESIFALCPPRSMLKPSYVLVLELFELLSHRNQAGDRVVAWTALPMCNEHMAVVDGKFRLPLLRGEVSPEVEHFRSMENAMAHDLNTWLCNAYVEIRHLPREVIQEANSSSSSATEGSKGASGSDKSLGVEYDFLTKQVRATGGAVGEEKALSSELLAANMAASASATANAHAVEEGRAMDGCHSSENSASTTPAKIEGTSSSAAVVYPSVDDRGLHQGSSRNIDGLFQRKGVVGGSGAGASTNAIANANASAGGMVRSGSGILKKGTTAHGGSAATLSDGEGKEEHKKSVRWGSSWFGGGSKAGGAADSDVLEEKQSLLPRDTKLGSRGASSLHIEGAIAVSDDETGGVGHGDDDDDEDLNAEEEVLERGYDSEDEFYLHEQQKGKLAGVEGVGDAEGRMWAASGITAVKVGSQQRTIVRRQQADGARFDTEIVPMGGAGGMKRSASAASMGTDGGGGMSPVKAQKEWEPLTDQREMETYTMSLSSDPGARKKLLPSMISQSKLRYLYLETFGDFAWGLWGSFDFYVAVLVFVMSLWIRVYVHYLGQYLFLQAIPTPVYGFEVGAAEMSFKYMSASISPQAEVGVVAVGPVANVILFLGMAGAGLALYRVAGFMPESGSKFIAAYGVCAILDPLLVLVVDLASSNYDCQRSHPDTCKEDYTSSDCKCFNGDFVKLWYRMEREEGSGLTGLVITAMVYSATMVLAALLFYEYMLRVHKDARILDLWRRIDGPAEEFFVPHDFEVSQVELTSICTKAALWRGANGATRKLVISDYLERDAYDAAFREHTKHYAIYQYELGGGSGDGSAGSGKTSTTRKTLYRHFLRLPDGSIIEIFEEFNIDVSQHTKALEKLLGAGYDQSKKDEGDGGGRWSGADAGAGYAGSRGGSSSAPTVIQRAAPKKLSIFKGMDKV